MPVLSPRALEGLKHYQYKPTGYTILDDIHQPFWNWLVSRLPLWLAPNLITLTGTLGLVLAYLIHAYYMPELDDYAPRWVYLTGAVAVVVYVHLDCIDGKQARRTGSSSPLGQLFDHGCDALSISILLANLSCCLGMPCGWIAAIGYVGVEFTWMLAHWEEYHTGVMSYGNQFYGVLEANYAIALLHVLTFILGPHVWRIPVSQLLPQLPWHRAPWGPDGGEVLLLRDALILVLVAVGQLQAWLNIYRVFTLKADSLPENERGNKQLGARAAAVHFLTLGLMLALGGLWLLDDTRTPLQCRGIMISFGTVYALTASQLIMAHMCKEPFEPSLWAIGLLAAGAINSRLRLVDPFLATVIITVVILAGYLTWVVSVINEICAYLDIRCLTIKKKAT